MRIKGLELHRFRNYTDLTLYPEPGLNILSGLNAEGKTNVLESIFLCALGRSHRTPHDAELLMDAAEGVRGFGAANPPDTCPRLRTPRRLRPEWERRGPVPGKTPKGANARPYRKPTQVDEANSLRCSRQLGRRNSAN